MKFLTRAIILLSVFFASISYAGGRLTATPTYYETLDKTRGNMGPAIYQNIAKGFSYNSWTGFGVEPSRHSDEYWLTTKHSIEYNFSKFGIAPGVQLHYTEEDKHIRERYFVKLSYQLW